MRWDCAVSCLQQNSTWWLSWEPLAFNSNGKRMCLRIFKNWKYAWLSRININNMSKQADNKKYSWNMKKFGVIRRHLYILLILRKEAATGQHIAQERNEKPSTSVFLLLLMLVVGFALPRRHKRYKFSLAPFWKNETRRWDISRKKREKCLLLGALWSNIS